MKNNALHSDQFDQIVRGRIHAADFGQPQTQADFYKEKAVSQIECKRPLNPIPIF